MSDTDTKKVKKVWERDVKKVKPTKFNNLLDVVKLFPTEKHSRGVFGKATFE